MATLQLHPNVVPLVGQAQVTARGSFPQLMVNPDHSLLKYAVWMTQQANFGPNGEVGVAEEDVSFFLSNALNPGLGAVDGNGVAPGVFTHGINAVFWDALWVRLVNDGFNVSEPAPSKGESLKAVRAFVAANGVAHADYHPDANDWYQMALAVGNANAPGRVHFLYDFLWEEATASDGSALWASVLMSYTRGWSIALARQDSNGMVRSPLDAMWMQA